MWTVVEQPFALMPGLLLRHLTEPDGTETACGEPLTQGAREVQVDWRRAKDRCAGCEQVGGVFGLN